MVYRWNDNDMGKPKYSEKNYASSTLPTTNFAQSVPRWNPDLRGERPETNRIKHDTADFEKGS